MEIRSNLTTAHIFQTGWWTQPPTRCKFGVKNPLIFPGTFPTNLPQTESLGDQWHYCDYGSNAGLEGENATENGWKDEIFKGIRKGR